MKKNKIVIISILAIIFILLIALGKYLSIKEWYEAKDKMNEYLENRYNEKFTYILPKKTIHTDGTGKTDTGYYIKTKSKKYPKIDIFTNYVKDVGIIEECWQSVKYAYLLQQELDDIIPYKHKLTVNGQIWERSWNKVYDNYEDYYNKGNNDKTVIYIYIEEKNINNDIKNIIIDVINKTPKNMKGKIFLQAVNWNYIYHNFNSIPEQYKLENWDHIEVEFSNHNINWEDMQFNNENDNCILKVL